MGYSKEEQETILVFDYSKGEWSVYSTVPKHIRKLAKLTDLETVESENGRPIAVKGILTEKMVTMKKERVMSESQKQKLSDRMKKVKNSSN